MEEISCHHCHKTILKNPRNLDQGYCGALDCQRARKSAWQRAKKANDPDYRMTQKAANEAWKKKNPNYWKNYRRGHPTVVKRNQELQRIRNFKKRSNSKTVLDASPEIAKMDASVPYTTWLLVPPRKQDIAKMDASNLLDGAQNGLILLIPTIAKMDTSKKY